MDKKQMKFIEMLNQVKKLEEDDRIFLAGFVKGLVAKKELITLDK